MVVHAVVVVAHFGLQLDAVNHFHRQGGGHVEGLAFLQTVVVGKVLNRIVERRSRVGIVRSHVGQAVDGERSVEHGVLQARVGRRHFSLRLVGATTKHLGLGKAEREVETHTLVRFGVQLERSVVALEARHLHDGFVVYHAVAKGVFHLVGAAYNREVVVERVADAAEGLLLPVVGGHVVVLVNVFPVAEEIGEGRRVGLVILLGLEHFQLVVPLHIVFGAEHVERVGHLLPRIVGIVGHLSLALLAALGRDEDNAVGTARTVDGRRRSVLEHVDGLDVGRRDVADVVDGETVNDVER